MRSGAESTAGHRLVPIEPLDPRSFPPTFEDDVCTEGRRAVRFRLQAQSDGVIVEGLFGPFLNMEGLPPDSRLEPEDRGQELSRRRHPPMMRPALPIVG